MIAIAGHRNLLRYPNAQATIRQALGDLVTRYPGALWLAGGDVGTEHLAVDALLELRQRVRLILPFPPAVLTRFWSAVDYYTLVRQVQRVEAIEVVRQTYHGDAYRQREWWTLDRADLLVAFMDPAIPFGDTVSTVRQALRRHKPVYWVGL